MLDVVNPATGKVFTRTVISDMSELDRVMNASQVAFATWRSDEDERRRLLRAAADSIESASADLGRTLTLEQGRPLQQTTGEARRVAAWFRYFADLESETCVIQDDDAARVEAVRQPLGVVGAITAWNYPLLIAGFKLAPALRAGNTVVVKPSPYTPLATEALCEILGKVLPPDVVAVLVGRDDLGRAMVTHPIPRKISLTGSTSAGISVAQSACNDLKRITLELGGNDAAIILADVDVDLIAGDLFEAAFRNNGQICTAVKRVYAPASLHAEIVEALTARASTVRLGDGLEPETELGPVANAEQLNRVEALVEDAVAHGARTVTGGQRLDREGYFYPPTIVVDVAEGHRLVDEEQFGPALPVMAYDSVDEAVQRANSTTFGLSGSVWSRDLERASSVAARLECGTTWINTHGVVSPQQPFGGHKSSGIGIEGGPDGLASFSEIQTRYVRK